jgi:1-acyl-sn-glycerol-3-phosphate acyltransferase
MWDTIIFFRLFRHPAMIFKRELLFVPIYGWAAARLGMIGIDRSAHASALRRMMKASRKRIAENRSIIIFPEGTRAKPGETIEYKPGVAALYRQLDIPCVPVAHNSGLCWPGRGWGFKSGTITLEILPPIDAGLPRKEFMAQLEDQIETASSRLATL